MHECIKSHIHLELHHAQLESVLVEVAERAAVGVARAGGVGHDDLHARVRSVIGSLALLTVVVPNVVSVLVECTWVGKEEERRRGEGI